MVGYDSTKAITLLYKHPRGNTKSGRQEVYFELPRNKVEKKKTTLQSCLATHLKAEEAAAVATVIRRFQTKR